LFCGEIAEEKKLRGQGKRKFRGGGSEVRVGRNFKKGGKERRGRQNTG